ncbi:hypothetical protein DPEC_G00354270 [Dallia pectoralis]|uniref:Uncharacterized protein n=1 Tax=Dallia pectoralis TaxID=75939 RepID=A0ACC2F2S3_DALPE|nr:hypothetical protein DPEC_G00354270 [Dallia pectoralis]
MLLTSRKGCGYVGVMDGKQRELPSWMAMNDVDPVNRKENTSVKRRKLFERTVLYCMNEKELVEASVIYLTELEKQDTKDTKYFFEPV